MARGGMLHCCSDGARRTQLIAGATEATTLLRPPVLVCFSACVLHIQLKWLSVAMSSPVSQTRRRLSVCFERELRDFRTCVGHDWKGYSFLFSSAMRTSINDALYDR